jgi:glycosyltransferase involved in cell wall biosynthesis
LKAPKDFLTLVRALARLSEGGFEALLVGDGPDRGEVEAEIVKLGVEGRVKLAGERSDVPALLADSDVFVLSSRSEGLPVSVLEAMAAELPVVASDVGGLGELVVDGETGLLVPSGDPAALAEALGRLLDDRELRQKLGAAGRARAEASFDLAEFRRAHVELYHRQLRLAGAVAEPPVEPAERG